MLVATLDHGHKVFRRLRRIMSPDRAWLVWDTETKAKKGFPSKDALVINRADILVTSVCYQGESYSFPTAHLSPSFPSIAEWLDLFNEQFIDRAIWNVFHNANYDDNVFKDAGAKKIARLYCTSIGVWKSCAAKPKELKARALLYGRLLRKTKSVDFTNIGQLSLYAEEDVIATDEIFQMQMYGEVRRAHTIWFIKADGTLTSVKNPMPVTAKPLVVENEDLDEHEKLDLYLQEFPYLRATIRAEQEGVPVSLSVLKKARVLCQQDLDSLLKKIMRLAGRDLNLNAPAQIAKLLTDLGVRITSRTKSGNLSVKANSLFKVRQQHPIIPLIEDYKQKSKLQSNYLGPIKRAIGRKRGTEHFIDERGLVHPSMNTVVTTGRTSCGNPNFQQLPSRRDAYGVKRSIRVRDDEDLIVLDHAQLELRVDTLFSQDPLMTKVLCDPKGDLHQTTADRLHIDRDPSAKNANFLLIFGGQAYVLSELLTSLGVPTSVSQAQVIIDGFNATYPRSQERRIEWLNEHYENGFIRLWTRRKRELLDVDWQNPRAVHKAETTLSNNAVQGSGQDFLKASIIRSDPLCINPDAVTLQRMILPKTHKAIIQDQARRVEQIRRKIKLGKGKWLLQVHDEAIWKCDAEASADLALLYAELMCMRHYLPAISTYSVPLVVDGGIGKDWKEAKDKKNPRHIKFGFDNWNPE